MALGDSGWRDGKWRCGFLFQPCPCLAGKLCEQVLDLHAQTARTFLHIDRALEFIRDMGNALDHTADQFGPLDGVVRRFRIQEVNLETDEIAAVLCEPFHERLAPQALGKSIGVLSVGQHGHLHVQAFAQDDVHTANGRPQPCRITVKEHGPCAC